jgi:hypothetical protein
MIDVNFANFLKSLRLYLDEHHERLLMEITSINEEPPTTSAVVNIDRSMRAGRVEGQANLLRQLRKDLGFG